MPLRFRWWYAILMSSGGGDASHSQHLKQMTLQSPSDQLKAGKILKAIADTGKWKTWEYIPENNGVLMIEGWSDEPGCRSKVVNWFMGTCNLAALKESDLWKTNF